MAETSRTSMYEPVPIGLGMGPCWPWRMVQMGSRVMFRAEGSGGGWTGGPVTTPGRTDEMEKGGCGGKRD